LEELKHKPNDPQTLAKAGGYYFATRQFGEATQFYEKAAKLRPTPDLLTKLSGAYYYSGSGEKAIAALDQALQMDPKFANALYNLGMLKWQVRGDTKGAIQAWEKLLKTNPNHPNRAQVERMIARLRNTRICRQAPRPTNRQARYRIDSGGGGNDMRCCAQ